MILAKQLIDSGSLPTRVFSDCGFSDYSSFYKAYVKHFAHSPSRNEFSPRKLPKI
ncbi:MAG: hypothetical protein IJY39_06680 [Clostridia bacterium]|nr:hypothetical protein [Clostridia bacterium]